MSDAKAAHAKGSKPPASRPRPAGRKSDEAQRRSNGAAAAERASAGMGTEESDPTEWLFGDSLRHAARAAARPY